MCEWVSAHNFFLKYLFQVILTYRGEEPNLTAKGIITKPLILEFKKTSVIFNDNSEEEIDSVIYCTGKNIITFATFASKYIGYFIGYQYKYPFLSSDCGIEVVNNWIRYLYKHMINVKHPTMAFLGVPARIIPFPMFRIQVSTWSFLRISYKQIEILDIIWIYNETKHSM